MCLAAQTCSQITHCRPLKALSHNSTVRLSLTVRALGDIVAGIMRSAAPAYSTWSAGPSHRAPTGSALSSIGAVLSGDLRTYCTDYRVVGVGFQAKRSDRVLTQELAILREHHESKAAAERELADK